MPSQTAPCTDTNGRKCVNLVAAESEEKYHDRVLWKCCWIAYTTIDTL